VTAADSIPHRCYLCEQVISADEQAAHFEAQHGPRLLIPTGQETSQGATMRTLFQQSAEWPVLAADIMVLLHHGAAAVGAASDGVQGDSPVAACLQEIDDAIASLALARQVLTDAVLDAGRSLLGPGDEQRG
jgi:hypothetical protein